jgi:tetratricopeptide (TPR) repeat protein
MTFAALALLLQLTVPLSLPPRSALPNPAAAHNVPKALQKDYNKTWERFLKGNDDKKVLADAGALLKKDKGLVPALMIQFYVHHYAGRASEAEGTLESILQVDPQHPLALNTLADAAFTKEDFVRASALYTTLLSIDRTRPELATRREKSLLLAVDGLLAKGRDALDAGHLIDAEKAYRDALTLAPSAAIHGELASVLMRQSRWEPAIQEYRRQIELGGSNAQSEEQIALALTKLGRGAEIRPDPDASVSKASSPVDLAELGRWGPELDRFRLLAKSEALSRSDFSWMLCRYFPQLSELPRNHPILTDVHNSGNDSEIHTIAGLGLLEPLPNHTFAPSRILTKREFAQALIRLGRVLRAFPTSFEPEAPPTGASAFAARQDIELAVNLGLLPYEDPVNADPAGPTRGQEAVIAVEKLLLLLSEKQP